MAWNESVGQRGLFALLCASTLAGCTALGERESPLIAATEGAPTVLDVYRQAPGSPPTVQTIRQRLQEGGAPAAVTPTDAQHTPYWSPLQPLQQRFSRLPNPDLVMVVYPHLAQGKYPVPGYVTVFPMYDETHYALPGEVQRLQAPVLRALPMPATPAPAKPTRPKR